jgi:NTP pyrophosphatase (non-canonical NTP hydrolase)
VSLTFDEYQRRAQETDQKPGRGEEALIMALLGLAGEAGSLLSEYKKRLRDGEAHRGFHAEVEEELGDLLWYLANIATKCDLSLADLAAKNLAKTRARWLPPDSPAQLFDDDLPPSEQLPRQFRYSFEYREVGSKRRVVMVDVGGQIVGDSLTDNAYAQDGYRFHDVLHLAHAVALGWSPVLRKLLGRKRRTSEALDEVEDGGRAQVLEETVAAASYEYAARHNFLNVTRIDWDLLRVIKRITANLEVRVRTEAEWERAILLAFDVWRQVREHDGGAVEGDLVARTLRFVPPVPK